MASVGGIKVNERHRKGMEFKGDTRDDYNKIYIIDYAKGEGSQGGTASYGNSKHDPREKGQKGEKGQFDPDFPGTIFRKYYSTKAGRWERNWEAAVREGHGKSNEGKRRPWAIEGRKRGRMKETKTLLTPVPLEEVIHHLGRT